MKKIFFVVMCMAAVLGSCTKKESAFYPERLQLVDSAYTRYVNEGYMPHCVAMVVKDGEVAYLKAFGYRDIEKQIPCETTDIFRMASQTKAIATVAFMTLFEEGKIQLDEPITKYLPEWDNPQILDSYDPATGAFTTHPAQTKLTVRHFITHTSGLCIDGFYDDIAEQLGVPTHMSYDSIPLREAVRLLAKMPLKHEPGAAFTYACNTNVLGALCEVISGQDIYTFIKERVLDPCEMTDTYFYLPEDKVERLVTLYRYPKGGHLERVEGIYQDFPYSGAKVFCSPSAGLCGSIQDYAHFCQMILNNGVYNGKRVIGRKTLEMMQKNGVGNMRGEIGFGMAWDVFTPENAHNTIVSEGSMRWGGMFGTDYIIDPQENMILLMYVNNMPNYSGYNAKTLLHNTVYQALK
jgi:CubicO group peptidase (beta-lactamase class C family)